MKVTEAQLLEVITTAAVLKDTKAFDAKKTFAEQGLDSLDQAFLLLAIERALKVSLAENLRNKPASLVGIIELLNEMDEDKS